MAGTEADLKMTESVRRTRKFEKFDRCNPKLTFILIYNHCFTLFCIYLILTGTFSWQMLVFKLAVILMSGFSITAGSHRLWSHRSFKAKLPLQIILMYFHTLTCQGPLYLWALWHRQHHKHSDTDGDPHNIQRGFFYAQIGWVAMYDHDKFMRNMEGEIETKDLEQDKVVMWQYRNFNWWVVVAYLTQMAIPWALNLETNILYLYTANELSLVSIMHFAGFVNSFAHMHGTKPFDKSIRPVDSLAVAALTFGEGWHNYHHCFPWDYSLSEYGLKYDPTRGFIDFFAYIGWVYDRKTASDFVIESRAERTGDGSFVKASDKTL